VPLEITWTVAEGYLIFGATPHAAMAAVEHARGAGPSVLDNPRFLEMGGDAWDGATYVTFTDIPRLARGGYGLAQLACSALANGVRSPANPRRDPGLILPAFNELMDGAKASVSIYRLDGDDLIWPPWPGASCCRRMPRPMSRHEASSRRRSFDSLRSR
jgi:hypothetical protein